MLPAARHSSFMLSGGERRRSTCEVFARRGDPRESGGSLAEGRSDRSVCTWKLSKVNYWRDIDDYLGGLVGILTFLKNQKALSGQKPGKALKRRELG